MLRRWASRRRSSPFLLASAALAVAALVHLDEPSAASACGGFFCNAAQPVNQAAERIIFAQGEDGRVTALIQIQYSGPSERFAWMLPVAGDPTVSVSSNAAFAALQSATNPSYLLTTTVEGTCRDDGRSVGIPGLASAGDAGAGSLADAGTVPSVTVVNQGSVGPYDYVVISVDPAATDKAATAIDWLQENNYDVNDFAADRLRPYLDGGMNLLTFRLTKGNSAGSIRPVRLTFGSGAPSIPIRPTAVAADDDMGVMVWVLGDHRAVPVNYLSLELNEALINWLSPSSTYNDVVTRAANEAGGQGFVTEMAGQASPLADAILPPWIIDGWTDILATDWTDREGALINDVLQTYAGMDGTRDVVANHVELPKNVTVDDLLACPGCYIAYDEPVVRGLEPDDFLADMTAAVFEPMAETRQLFLDHRYMTRLYTTMSADEMTMDPIFDFNRDLPEYSNQHNAERIIECSPSVYQFDAPWRIELASGDVVRGLGSNWPFTTNSDAMPANARTRRIGTSGMGEVRDDNTAAISAALITHNQTIPPPARGGGGCSIGEGIATTGTSSGLFGLLIGAFVVGLRRRSRA